MIDIFNIKDGLFKINSEVLTLKSFRDVYNRDTFPDKHIAEKEFLYIYHMSSYKSLGVKRGLENSTLHNFAVTNSDLDDTFRQDDLIRTAIKEYKYHQNSPIDEQLIVLNKITNTRNEALEVLSKLLKNQITNLSTTDNKVMDSFFSLSERISSFVNKIEKDFDIIKKLQSELTQQEDKVKLIYGKKEHHSSLDNDKDIENYENDTEEIT
jgi:hypothetical protein